MNLANTLSSTLSARAKKLERVRFRDELLKRSCKTGLLRVELFSAV